MRELSGQQQLALEHTSHHYQGARMIADGWVGMCLCGWRSLLRPTRRSAQAAVAGHIGQAPDTKRR